MSENTSNNIPELLPVSDFLQDDNWFDVDIDGDLLDFDKPYRPPRYTMERNGVPFADVGELHIISGKPGNGKTGLMSQLEATLLSKQFGNTIAREVTHKVKDANGNVISEETIPTRILHIDTEQGEDDTIGFKNRIMSMSGRSQGAPEDTPTARYGVSQRPLAQDIESHISAEAYRHISGRHARHCGGLQRPEGVPAYHQKVHDIGNAL